MTQEMFRVLERAQGYLRSYKMEIKGLITMSNKIRDILEYLERQPDNKDYASILDNIRTNYLALNNLVDLEAIRHALEK